jgi:hypothetical protein
MLQRASGDPTLVKRSRSQAKSVQLQTKLLPAEQHESGSPLTLLFNSDLATRQYLEDLVSIAVASAERADDVLNLANATGRKANRAMWAFASVATVGVVVAAVGVVSSRSGNATGGRLTEIAGEVRSLGAQQELTSHQLAAVRSDVTDEHEAVEAIQQTATPPRLDAASRKQGRSRRWSQFRNLNKLLRYRSVLCGKRPIQLLAGRNARSQSSQPPIRHPGRNTRSRCSQPGPLGIGSSRRYHDSSSSFSRTCARCFAESELAHCTSRW